ncbi:MAG: xylan 1,4-beta-xylosidase [Clostridia bacterium]|nr:xylan 1,4-beta-xylosidase [Clostridia bacterium]
MKDEKRFEKVYTQGLGTMQIWVDRETGVQYLVASMGYGGGITPLLDRDGKPVVSPVTK